MKRVFIGFFIGFLFISLFGCGEKASKSKEIDLNYNSDLQAYTSICDSDIAATVARIVMPATVEISSTFEYSYTSSYPFPFGGGSHQQNGSSSSKGTGFFINEDGYIVTNAHVVRLTDYESLNGFTYEKTKYVVNYADSSTLLSVSLIDYDVDLDIAILKLDEGIDNLQYVTFFNLTNPGSEKYNEEGAVKLLYGEKAIAIGNANGYGISVTEGVVSAPVRYYDDGAKKVLSIQTDAAINSGNSGGPLANKFGAVIGVNTFKTTETTIENIGFAIPSNVVIDYICDISSDINFYYTNFREYNTANTISRIN